MRLSLTFGIYINGKLESTWQNYTAAKSHLRRLQQRKHLVTLQIIKDEHEQKKS
jgi:hypothetical protein